MGESVLVNNKIDPMEHVIHRLNMYRENMQEDRVIREDQAEVLSPYACEYVPSPAGHASSMPAVNLDGSFLSTLGEANQYIAAAPSTSNDYYTMLAAQQQYAMDGMFYQIPQQQMSSLYQMQPQVSYLAAMQEGMTAAV